MVFVANFRDQQAVEFYLKSRHLPPHEESGFVDLPIEWVFALEVGDTRVEDFLNFICYQKGIKKGDPEDSRVKWIGSNGWYEFPDINNTDKWLIDFYDFQEQQKELQRENGIGIQMTLF
ncbi:MAG: hypothetical protein HC831_19855 [Chloroflexia bacterium]|nr:hypothetical protein [Chloroflexia bacterium]